MLPFSWGLTVKVFANWVNYYYSSFTFFLALINVSQVKAQALPIVVRFFDSALVCFVVRGFDCPIFFPIVICSDDVSLLAG